MARRARRPRPATPPTTSRDWATRWPSCRWPCRTAACRTTSRRSSRALPRPRSSWAPTWTARRRHPGPTRVVAARRYSVGLSVFSAGLRRHRAQPAGNVGGRGWLVRDGDSWHRVHRRFPVPDRLHGAPAAPRQRPYADRRPGVVMIKSVYPKSASALTPEAAASLGPLPAPERLVEHVGGSGARRRPVRLAAPGPAPATAA